MESPSWVIVAVLIASIFTVFWTRKSKRLLTDLVSVDFSVLLSRISNPELGGHINFRI